MQTLLIDRQGAGLTVRLNRPNSRNAMDARMIGELTETFSHLPPEVRVVELCGAGPVFCAGADLNMMKASATFTEAQNRADAERLARLFKAVDKAPAVVVGKASGVAMGGAVGLLACCDLVVATPSTRFGLTEARLGLIPAVISPYVVAKIGWSWARRYFVTGELFDGAAAHTMGLVHKLAEPGDLDAAVAAWQQAVLTCAPGAVVAAKALLRSLADLPRDQVHAHTIDMIARLRVAPEAQEGLTAFLQKRKPSWVP